MALSDTSIRKAKPSSKMQRIFDGGGLYLEIAPTGGKWWRLKFRQHGKEKRISLGTYPDTGLAEAREKRDTARKLLAAGIDPGEQRKAEKAAGANRAANSFEVIAREWLQKQSGKLAPTTHVKAVALFETWAFPWIGSRPVAEITPRELLESVLRRVESAGKLETVHRLKQRCGQVFRYAIATGRAERDPTPDLRGALETHKPRSHSALTDPAKIGELLRAMDGYKGGFATCCALHLTPLVFVRPGELRRAEWAEFDLDGEHPQWSIPADKMKMDAPHIVPLSMQAVSVLRELHPLTGGGQYVFPGAHSRARPMSENTVNVALRRLGFTGAEMVAHGFRSMASTLLNEQGWPPDVIERQLAHAERNEIRRAYNRAKYLPERRKMMQAWSDYLDGLRTGARVVPIKRKRA